MEFMHSHHPHSVTNQLLFYLMMGYEPCALPTVMPKTSFTAIETHLKSLNATRNEALTTHKLACQVMSSRNQQGFKPFERETRCGWRLKT